MCAGQCLSGDGAPWLEPFLASGQGADARLDAIGDDQQGVVREQGRQFSLVGLALLPCRPDGGFLVSRVLQLQQHQRQAVDEEHYVRPSIALIFDNGELIYHKPVVVGRSDEVDDARLSSGDVSVLVPVLHRHTIHQMSMYKAVTRLKCRRFRVGQFSEGIIECFGWQGRVKAGKGAAQALLQHHLSVVPSFGSRLAGGDVEAVPDGIAEAVQPGECGFLDDGFVEGGHDWNRSFM